MADNNSKTLPGVIKFLVNENRTSRFDPEQRLGIMRTKRFGRLLRLLHPFGFGGGLFFAAGAIIMPPDFTVFRSLIVEDHASRVIRNSLDRALSINSDKESKKLKPSRFSVLLSFFRNMGSLRQSYREAGINHFTEYARVFSVFFFYIAWKAFFPRFKPAGVLLARTNDPKRLALGAVADECGISVSAFTVERVALRNTAPFRIQTQFCWSKSQAEFAGRQGINPVRMPVPYISGMKTPVPANEKAVYGFLLNAKCDVPMIEEFLRKLSDMHGVRNLQVRPHPGFDESRLSRLPNATVCDWREPLKDFLGRIDATFALNSNAIIDALLQGIPVVYASGLDTHFDLHGFVSGGIVLPYSDNLRFPDSVTGFFESKDFCDKWNTDEFTTDVDGERAVLNRISGSME